MNKYFLIITILTFVLLFSCAEQSMEKSNTEVIGNAVKETGVIEELFSELEEEKAELNTEQLAAFEQRAIQKLEDFTDYVAIISNPQTNKALKIHSLNLSLELFKNDSITIEYPPITGENNLTVKAFLIKIKMDKHLLKAKIKSVKISKPLTLDSLNNYSGLITTTIKIGTNKVDKNITIHLISTKKKFGKKIQTINEIRLGNIY